MAWARYKDLCIDAVDERRSATFWAAALGLGTAGEPGSSYLGGDTDRHRVWLNVVAEHKSAKNRTHLDIHTAAVSDLVALGASLVEQYPHWIVLTDPDGLADPDGNEFCVFTPS